MAVNDLGIIDGFMFAFNGAIDSGFGLLSGDVAFLSTILIGIDVTLAGLFWAFGEDGDHIFTRLIRKVLYVGFFAWILNDFRRLSGIIYSTFSSLGLKASGSGLDADILLRPGAIAATGYKAAFPFLKELSHLMGFPELFTNALTVFVLLLAWVLVVFAFFLLAIQLFISVLEFKLTTLAGFVLVPFALWNKTAFLAERVLGNVISSGVKMMVLALIIGIGSTVFTRFTTDLGGADITLSAAMSQVLGALSLLGLSIFGPGIASGLVAGAPQLGAGAALGTAGAAAGATALTGGAIYSAARKVGSHAALRAGTDLGSAGTGKAAGAGAAKEAAGAQAKTANPSSSPDWAKKIRTEQSSRMRAHAVGQAIKDGDRPGHGANPSLQQKDEPR